MNNKPDKFNSACLFDIGLVYRSNHNYGANMTHCALFWYLQSRNYSVVMIDLQEDSYLYLPLDRYTPFKLFQNNPYPAEVTAYHFKHKWDYIKMNDVCRLFVVGSDQLWRNYFLVGTDYYSTLDWTRDEKCRISYATSFGTDIFEGGPEDTRKMCQKLKRFQHISVREESGVKIIKEIVGNPAECVLDPVFLCNVDQYDKLIHAISLKRLPAKRYLGAYILDQTEYAGKIFEIVMQRKAIKECVLIEDAMESHDGKGNDILQNASVEEWLGMIKNSDFFVTDSFHGTCFAIIFHKQFVVMLNPASRRGYTRIENLLTKIGLENRIITEMCMNQITDIVDEPIDYNEVDNKLNKLRRDSIVWFESALADAENCEDRTVAQGELFSEIIEKKKDYEKTVECVKRNISKVITEDDRMFLWGAGNCFREAVKMLVSLYDIKTVIDNDCTKWGKAYLNKIICKSPENIYNGEAGTVAIIMMKSSEEIEKIKHILRQNGVEKYVTYNQLYEKNESEG